MKNFKTTKILGVRVEHVQDTDTDTSYLGMFTDTVSEWAIVRNGDQSGEFVTELPQDADLPRVSRGEYRFFLPAQHVPHNLQNWSHVQGEALARVIAEHGSIENADKYYAKADWQRAESLSAGNWQFIGIIAKAEIQTASGLVQTIRSGGLWGVESDSGKEYLAEVSAEELSRLKAELIALSQPIGKRTLAYAFKNVETVNK